MSILPQFKVELLRHRRPGKFRMTLKGLRLITPDNNAITDSVGSYQAFDDLLSAGRNGQLIIYGLAPRAMEWCRIPIEDLTGLIFEIDGDYVGLRNAAGTFAWSDRWVHASAVKRLWPGPNDRVVRSNLTEGRIRECLLVLLAKEVLSKKEALAATKKSVSGWTRGAFEDAWRNIDDNLKITSGKRGLGRRSGEKHLDRPSKSDRTNSDREGISSR